jgi:GDP-mannose 4,6-dehydratase
MKILVTGGSGFVGSHLLAPLIEQDHELFSLGRERPAIQASGAEGRVQLVFCELRDHAAVRQVLRQLQPEAVIHLASVSPVAYSYGHPNEVLEANFLGTVNLAEGCLGEVPRLRQFLFASTSETYGNGPVPKTEETPQNPNSPYSVSKLAAEKYLLYLRDAYNLPLTVLRPFNTYGRKESATFVVERTILQMLRGNTVKLGNPAPIRDWLYIEDHVRAYLTCLNRKGAIGEVFNFCTGRGTSVRELVDLLSRIISFQGELLWNTVPHRPLDINAMVGDSSKAARILGWQPHVSLEEGLRLTVEYWRQKISASVAEIAARKAST